MALVSCGGSGDGGRDIPPEIASAMLSQLDEARQADDQGDCQAVKDAADEIGRQIAALPATVDTDVRDPLNAGNQQLADLAESPATCEEQEEEETTTEAPTVPTETATEPTETETETETETTTTKTETETETEPAPPSGDEGPDDTGGTGGGGAPGPGTGGEGPGGEE